MRFSKIASTMVFLGAMVALAPSAYAQDGKMSLGGGYQYLHMSNSGGSLDRNGFFVDFTGALPQKTGSVSWAWTGELTDTFKDGHTFTISGGAQGSWEMNPQVKPFVDAQIGIVSEGGSESNANTDAAFLFVIGGGVKIPLMGQKFSILTKLDYMRAFYGDDHGGGQNFFRLGIGVAIPLPLK